MTVRHPSCFIRVSLIVLEDGIIEVPRSEAAKLVNTTMPVPEDPTQYVVELDFFHELHCLLRAFALEKLYMYQC